MRRSSPVEGVATDLQPPPTRPTRSGHVAPAKPRRCHGLIPALASSSAPQWAKGLSEGRLQGRGLSCGDELKSLDLKLVGGLARRAHAGVNHAYDSGDHIPEILLRGIAL